MHRWIKRAVPAAAAATALFVGLGASPAPALVLSPVVNPFVDVPTGLSGYCSVAQGVADTSGATFVIDGTATATGGAALSTGLTCTVKTDYGTWGAAAGGAPGGVVPVAGESYKIPLDKLAGLRVCASANTLYYPNTPRSYTQPNC
jgi:hypothetical protein